MFENFNLYCRMIDYRNLQSCVTQATFLLEAKEQESGPCRPSGSTFHQEL